MPRQESGGFTRFAQPGDQYGDLIVTNPDGTNVGSSTTVSPQTASALGANPPATVAASTTTAAVCPANASRKGGTLYSNGAAEVYVCLAATATVASAAFALTANQSWDFQVSSALWTGPVSVITAAGTATVIFAEV